MSKFKTISNINDIHRIIASDTKTDAPFDEKNNSTDWIEELFGSNFGYYRNQYNGFISNIPTYIKISGHCMMIQPIGRNIDSITDAIILGNLSEILNQEDDGRIDDDSELIAICETDKRKGVYFIRFYHGKYIGK